MSSYNKIKDNPSFKDIEKTVNGFGVIYKITNFLSKIGIKNKELSDVLSKYPDLKKDYERLSSITDRFNEHFSEKGWIAYDSFNVNIMEEAVILADEGKYEDAEAILTDFYDHTDNIEWHVIHTNGVDEFKPRYDLIRKAFDDYKYKRYHSCVPIILMMIDGIINDVCQKGFFSNGVELTVWDSITGHRTGLGKLSQLFSSTRKKTTTETITIPFRNGIIHGRDLGYDNKIVAAKCWAALFAVKDWVQDTKKKMKGEPIDDGCKKGKGLRSWLNRILGEAKRLSQHSMDNELLRKNINEWKKREVNINTDVPEYGELDDYEVGTPEYAAIMFITYWKKNNYGKMASMIARLGSKKESINKIAGSIRERFCGKDIKGYRITKISDTAPARSLVSIELKILYECSVHSKEYEFILLYKSDDNSVTMRGMSNGRWTILDSFDIEFLPYE